MTYRYGGAIAAMVVVAWALAGCAAPVESRPSQPPMTVEAQTPDGVVGAYRMATSLWLYAGTADGSMTPVTSTADAGGSATVHLATYGGQTGMIVNSFVYGSMPARATSVVVGPGHVSGTVANGTYVVALTIKDLSPADLTWIFLDGAGAVVQQGSNITP